MAKSLVENVWDDVYERMGEDLRAVTRYDATDFDTRMRDDVRARYTSDEDQRIVDDTIINQLSLRHTEDAFKVGDLDATIRVFEEAWIVTWPDSLPKKSGFIISVEREGESTGLQDIDWILRYLDDEIAPQIG